MNDSIEPTESTKEDLAKAGLKTYSTAIRVSVTGGIGFVLFTGLAILSLFSEGGDSAGPSFFIFGFLAMAVLIISSSIAILLSLAGVVNSATALNQSNNSKEESISGITKNVSLLVGIILVLLVLFKFLKNFW